MADRGDGGAHPVDFQVKLYSHHHSKSNITPKCNSSQQLNFTKSTPRERERNRERERERGELAENLLPASEDDAVTNERRMKLPNLPDSLAYK